MSPKHLVPSCDTSFQYHGGTNFGRTAGGPFIATSYDYDAPIDEYGEFSISMLCSSTMYAVLLAHLYTLNLFDVMY